MNSFIVFSALLAIAAAMPFDGSVSLTQDTVGNYKLDVDTKESHRNEEGHADGSVIGGYTFTDEHGIVHEIRFVSGAHGYTATGSDIPQEVHETPEVAAVRAAHEHEAARLRAILPPLPEEHEIFVAPAPAPFEFIRTVEPHHFIVDNTAEIAAERAAHFAAHKAAIDRLNEEYAKIAHHF